MSDLTNTALAEIAAALASRYEQGSVGVGNGGATAFDPAQTDLAGTSKQRVTCSSVYAEGATLTMSATFGFEDGNFAWQEIGAFLNQDAGPMLTRKVLAGIGTKSPEQEWIADAIITFTHPT